MSDDNKPLRWRGYSTGRLVVRQNRSAKNIRNKAAHSSVIQHYLLNCQKTKLANSMDLLQRFNMRLCFKPRSEIGQAGKRWCGAKVAHQAMPIRAELDFL